MPAPEPARDCRRTRRVRQDEGMILSPATPPALSVLTQNIRQERSDTAPRAADHWAARAPVLAAPLQRADVDVLGTQQPLPPHIPVMDAALGPPPLRPASA